MKKKIKRNEIMKISCQEFMVGAKIIRLKLYWIIPLSMLEKKI